MNHQLACSLFALFALPLAARAADAVKPPLDAPPADMAQVVFIDPTNAIANAFPPALYDTSATPRNYLVTMAAHANAVQLLTPGHHLLMVRQMAVTQFLDANVEAGHRYYVLVRFIYGHGFQLRPLRSTGMGGADEFSVANPKFGEWLSDAKWITRTPAMDAWNEQTAPKADEVQAKGLVEWNAKTPEQRAELSLTRADAFDK